MPVLTHLNPRVAVILIALPACMCAAQAGPAAPPGAAVTGRDVLAHLEQTIGWFRHMNAVEQSAGTSGDVLLHGNLRGMAIKALQLAFVFARAEAALLNARQPANGSSEAEASQGPSTRMQRAAARATERVATLESAIAALDAAIEKAPARSRPVFIAQRKQQAAQLELAKRIRDAVQSLVTFTGAVASDASSGLAAQITQLERSVPEAARGHEISPAASQLNTATPGSPQTHTEAAGIAGLLNELFAVSRARSQVMHMIEQTDALLKSMDQLRAPLGRELRNAIQRSDALASAPPSDDLEQLAAARNEIETLGSSFKQISAVTVPLREQAIVMDSSRGDLQEWKEALDQRYSTAARSVLIRLAILGIAIGLVLGISELWRRMTFRYIRETRRRRQFLVLRRVAVTGAIGLVVVLGLVTELGSLATYAGFLTAGLALALQSPILSVVGYFFLIGRYGLRVGDRVTITGVTGEVVDIGLVRIYLMELAGTGADRHATGRIVVFSNSVLFQPAALFKQMPGTDYVWHTVRLTLAPDTDCPFAERRLSEAVDSVYEQYRETIEQQHAAFERLVDIKVAPPHPEGRLRFSDAGLEFTARYPAEMRRAAEMDDRVLKALSEAIANEPRLVLANSGAPKLLEAN